MSTELALCDQINELLEHVITVNRHSYFQIKYFIVMKEPTHQARLWRCVKELEVRNDSMRAIKMEIDDSMDNLRLAEIELERTQGILGIDPLDKEEREIQVRKRIRQKTAAEGRLLELKKKLKEAEEEAKLFYELFKALEQKETLKPYDDLESQTQMWNEKISQEFDLRALLGLPIDLELAKTTLALENNTPIKQKFVNKLQEVRAEATKIKEMAKVQLAQMKSE